MDIPNKKRKTAGESPPPEKLCCSMSDLLRHYGIRNFTPEVYKANLKTLAGTSVETTFPDRAHSETGDLKILHMSMEESNLGVATIPKNILCAEMLAFIEAGQSIETQVFDGRLLAMAPLGQPTDLLCDYEEKDGSGGHFLSTAKFLECPAETTMSAKEASVFHVMFTDLCADLPHTRVSEESAFLVRFTGPYP